MLLLVVEVVVVVLLLVVVVVAVPLMAIADTNACVRALVRVCADQAQQCGRRVQPADHLPLLHLGQPPQKNHVESSVCVYVCACVCVLCR